MACGTPVVGSNVGGIKFTVRDGETGYLVPPNDPDALGERLAHLYRHPKLMGVYRRQAIRRANDLFTWKRVADAMAVLYEQVMTAARPERVRGGGAVGGRGSQFRGRDRPRWRSPPSPARADARCRRMIGDAFARDGRLLVCGNGGIGGGRAAPRCRIRRAVQDRPTAGGCPPSP